ALSHGFARIRCRSGKAVRDLFARHLRAHRDFSCVGHNFSDGWPDRSAFLENAAGTAERAAVLTGAGNVRFVSQPRFAKGVGRDVSALIAGVVWGTTGRLAILIG